MTFHQAGWLNQFTEGPDEPAQKKQQEDDQEQQQRVEEWGILAFQQQ